MPEAENHEIRGHWQRCYNSVIEIGSDGAQSQIIPVTASFVRRPSKYEASSIDSGLSGLSTSASDSKVTSYCGYYERFYCGCIRDANSSYSSTSHRSLPTPTQQTYNRVPQLHLATEAPGTKENMWSIGNASPGHGNGYMAPKLAIRNFSWWDIEAKNHIVFHEVLWNFHSSCDSDGFRRDYYCGVIGNLNSMIGVEGLNNTD